MTLPDAVARPRIAAVDLACSDDPYPEYERLRAQGPVVRGEFGQWLVVHHGAVSALLRDGRLASHFPREFIRLTLGHGPAAEFPTRIVLTQDPPEHTHARRFLGQAFGTPRVRAMTPAVAALVEELLAPARDAGRLDLVTDLAVPLPVTVICRLIGIPDADRDQVLPRVIELAQVFDAANLKPDERDGVDAAVAWLREYVTALLRDATPGDSTLAGMFAAATPEERGTSPRSSTTCCSCSMPGSRRPWGWSPTDAWRCCATPTSWTGYAGTRPWSGRRSTSSSGSTRRSRTRSG